MVALYFNQPGMVALYVNQPDTEYIMLVSRSGWVCDQNILLWFDNIIIYQYNSIVYNDTCYMSYILRYDSVFCYY